MTPFANNPNDLLETSSPGAATRWDEILALQVDLFFPHELQFLFDWPQWHRARSVVDVGCGNGYYLSRLHSHFPDKHYQGIDVSSELIAVAQDRHPELSFQAADFLHYHPSERVDLILMRFIVQHLQDLPSILAMATRLLNPGGGLLIIEPDFENSKNVPETPIFMNLLRTFHKHNASKGRIGAQLESLESWLGQAADWCLSDHVRLPIPHVGPFCKTDVLRLYRRWIDLIEGSNQIRFPYHSAREELTAWSKSPNTFSQIGLHAFHLQFMESLETSDLTWR